MLDSGESRKEVPRPAGYTLPRLVTPAVLLLVNAAGEEGIYGYHLKKQFRDFPFTRVRPPDITGVYRVLRRLEAQGYLISEVKPPIKGPERKIFRITPEGKKYLQEWIKALEDIITKSTNSCRLP
jgi:DNA-binding PadR family transcriptional regulator